MAKQPWYQPLREIIGTAIQGPEPQQRFERQMSRLAEAYMDGPFKRTPDQLMAELRELGGYDTIDILNRMEGWEDFYSYSQDQEGERQRSVRENKRAWRRDVLTDWIVQMWTNFGMGESIVIEPKDANLKERFDEFWYADRNKYILSQDALHDHSNNLIVTGEFYWAMYYNTMTGEPTVSIIDGEEIVEVITDPINSKNPVLYKRQWLDADKQQQTLYYLDNTAAVLEEAPVIKELLEQNSFDAFIEGETSGTRPLGRTLKALKDKGSLAHLQVSTTFVCLIPCVHNKKGGLRGWPLMSAGVWWSKAHKDFRENRASAAALVASVVAKIKIRGGSRATDAFKAAFGTSIATGSSMVEKNAAPGYASTFTENENMEYSKLPLGTAAGDAREDGNALLLMAGLGGRVFPHWLGAGDAFRLATATSMETPLFRNWTRYQSFWSAQYRSLVRMVAWGYETFGKDEYDTYKAEVSTDRLVEIDLAMVSRGLSFMANNALRSFVEMGVISHEVANKLLSALWRQILMALNVPNIDELAGEKAFAVGMLPTPQPKEENGDGNTGNGEEDADGEDRGDTSGETPRGVETGR